VCLVVVRAVQGTSWEKSTALKKTHLQVRNLIPANSLKKIHNSIGSVVPINLETSHRNEDGFWNTPPCSLVEVNRRFRRAFCLHHQDDEQTTWEKLAGRIRGILAGTMGKRG
jgi:hypothetical protein